MDSKTEQLETAIAHQDRQIQDLSEMIARQWAEIDRLRRDVDRMRSKLQMLESAAPADDTENLSVAELAAREKPPHY